MNKNLDDYLKLHYVHRSNWLRAAVLGANDGILSMASLTAGVAAASVSRETVVLASLAGLVAGALSMAAGEYVSVSSQTDVEKADIIREKKELKESPEEELELLTQIYISRGLKRETAQQVAIEMTEHDPLEAHVRDELGIIDRNSANPIQAAFASFSAFAVGGLLPLIVALVAPLNNMEFVVYGSSIVFLILLGYVSAKAGGSPPFKAIIRLVFWGTVAMGITIYVGHLFGVNGL
ncbi:MAG: VIT family protein [Brumimicrobium sp.]|nr:VIT family protein [Brumimicrobium sp.]